MSVIKNEKTDKTEANLELQKIKDSQSKAPTYLNIISYFK